MISTLARAKTVNPFRPGAGHTPPYLAGRKTEIEEFCRLLKQDVILENLALTGLRGVGKTVLLEAFKPLAFQANWLWVEIDMSEASSLSDEMFAMHLLTDLAVATSQIPVPAGMKPKAGFAVGYDFESTIIDYTYLKALYDNTPGLISHKLKNVFKTIFPWIRAYSKQGIVFALDEAQNLTNHANKDQYPLSLLLDIFQWLQRNGIRFMLVATGLPTLFEQLVDARTFAERMFRVVSLGSLNEQETIEAVRKPIEQSNAPVYFSEENARLIWKATKGFPYFVQYFCRHTFDSWVQTLPTAVMPPSIPVTQILRKLDSDFFVGRWSKASKLQQELLRIAAQIPEADMGFAVQDIVDDSTNRALHKPFGMNEIVQSLEMLADLGLVYHSGCERYSFALPLLGEFIRRQ